MLDGVVVGPVDVGGAEGMPLVGGTEGVAPAGLVAGAGGVVDRVGRGTGVAGAEAVAWLCGVGRALWMVGLGLGRCVGCELLRGVTATGEGTMLGVDGLLWTRAGLLAFWSSQAPSPAATPRTVTAMPTGTASLRALVVSTVRPRLRPRRARR